MNLPDLYARVVAKRPELAVPFLEHCPDDDPNDKCPWIGEDNDLLTESTAAALILARWVEALPAWFKLSKQDNSEDPRSIGGVMWWVEDCLQAQYEAYEPTPIQALAAFYLGEQP